MNFHGLWSSRQDDNIEKRLKALEDDREQNARVIHELRTALADESAKYSALKGEKDSQDVTLQKLKRKNNLLFFSTAFFAFLSVSLVIHYGDFINKFVLEWNFLEPITFLLKDVLLPALLLLLRLRWRS